MLQDVFPIWLCAVTLVCHCHKHHNNARRCDALAMPVGVQLCSDVNRPEGCHILGALGVEVILAPRATERATFDRWELLFRANAMTSCCYILSVNRPGPEHGVPLGGPSLAVAPDGEVIARSDDALTVVSVSSEHVARCRTQYPGYLTEAAEVYAAGWSEVWREVGGADLPTPPGETPRR